MERICRSDELCKYAKWVNDGYTAMEGYFTCTRSFLEGECEYEERIEDKRVFNIM